MIGENSKIRKGLPPKRDPVCYQVLHDIILPAGTILRSQEDGKFGCGVGGGNFQIKESDIIPNQLFKKVIA